MPTYAHPHDGGARGPGRSFTPRHPPSTSPPRSLLGRIRWRKFFKRVFVTVAIVCVSYLVVANVLLRTRLLRNVVSGSSVSFAVLGNSTDLRLDYASAYSIVPGRVHVDGLTLRGRERRVEWFLTLDHADVAISLRDLLHHTFHATRLRSSGLAIRARVRLDRVDATPDIVAALPPIAGFADPPLLDEGSDPPPLTGATYNLWAVDLEDVDVEHVREVWIHTLRAEGDTRVRGRWIFHPQRGLDVGPATVDANGVDFSYGSIPLATGVRGSFGATVVPFDSAGGESPRCPRPRHLRRAPGRSRGHRRGAAPARAPERGDLQSMGGAVRRPRGPGPRQALGRDACFVRDDGLCNRGGRTGLRGADSHRAGRRGGPSDRRHPCLRS